MPSSNSITEGLLLRRLAVAHQKVVAAAIGADETLVSRFASGERGLRIGQIGPALQALGLKLVDSEEVTIPAKKLEALMFLARESLGEQK
jgi:hypothetical protein